MNERLEIVGNDAWNDPEYPQYVIIDPNADTSDIVCDENYDYTDADYREINERTCVTDGLGNILVFLTLESAEWNMKNVDMQVRLTKEWREASKKRRDTALKIAQEEIRKRRGGSRMKD